MRPTRPTFDELVNFFSIFDVYPIKINDIREWILERKLQDSIEIHIVDINPSITKGQCLQFESSAPDAQGKTEKKAIITVARNLSYCWKRFVIAKEMTHLIDDPKTYTNTIDDISTLTTELSAQAPISVKDSATSRSDAYFVERMAEYKALALLAPKEAIEKLKPKYIKGELTDIEIATFFRIPVLWVPVVMSEAYSSIYDDILADP